MKIAVVGAKGRVGKAVVAVAKERGHDVWEIDKRFRQKAGCECDADGREKSHKEKSTSGVEMERKICPKENGVDEICEKMGKIDVVIDFSAPDATTFVTELCRKAHASLVSGVTGLNFEQEEALCRLGREVAIVRKNNFAPGAQTLEEICRLIATKHPEWDCDIVETHRRGKADSPSGTAKSVAYEISKIRGGFRAVTVHSLRSGGQFGRHEVVWGAENECVTIIHQAFGVKCFALGAVQEAEKLGKK